MKFLKYGNGKDFRDEVIRLADLADLVGDEGVIENSHFERCQLIGPAIFLVQGESHIVDSEFQGDPDEYLWVIPPNRPRVIGTILIKDSTFEDCTFMKIGVAGTEEYIQRFRENVSRHPVT